MKRSIVSLLAVGAVAVAGNVWASPTVPQTLQTTADCWGDGSVSMTKYEDSSLVGPGWYAPWILQSGNGSYLTLGWTAVPPQYGGFGSEKSVGAFTVTYPDQPYLTSASLHQQFGDNSWYGDFSSTALGGKVSLTVNINATGLGSAVDGWSAFGNTDTSGAPEGAPTRYGDPMYNAYFIGVYFTANASQNTWFLPILQNGITTFNNINDYSAWQEYDTFAGSSYDYDLSQWIVGQMYGATAFAADIADVKEWGLSVLAKDSGSITMSQFDLGPMGVPEPETVWMIVAVLASLGVTFRRQLMGMFAKA